MSGEVREVWGAYHERERLCPEGVRVREIAHVQLYITTHHHKDEMRALMEVASSTTAALLVTMLPD